MRGQVGELAASVRELEDTLIDEGPVRRQHVLVHEVDIAAQLVDHVNSLGDTMGWNFGGHVHVRVDRPGTTALQGNPSAMPMICSATRGAFER